MLTTDEAAALLSERGVKGYQGQPLKADSIKHMCARGVFPHAQKKRGPGRGYWLIPRADIDILYPSTNP